MLFTAITFPQGSIVKMSQNEIRFYVLGEAHSDPTIQQDERQGFGNPIADLPSLFAEHGWDSGQGTALFFKPNKEQAQRAIAQRKELLALWEVKAADVYYPAEGSEASDDTARITYGELARFAKSQWVDAKGKFIEPIAIANSCIRRTFAAPASALVWAASGKNRKPEQFRIPGQVREYVSERDMAHDRWAENDLIGRVGYTPADDLARMVKEVQWGATEQECMRIFGLARGSAQKYHKLAQLNNKFRELNIVERCRMKMPKNDKDSKPVYKKHGAILLSGVRKDELANLLDKGAKSKELSAKAMGKENGPATAEQVERYFKLLIGGRENAPATVGVDSLKTLRAQMNDDTLTPRGAIVKEVIDAILAGQSGEISKIINDATPVK